MKMFFFSLTLHFYLNAPIIQVIIQLSNYSSFCFVYINNFATRQLHKNQEYFWMVNFAYFISNNICKVGKQAAEKKKRPRQVDPCHDLRMLLH